MVVRAAAYLQGPIAQAIDPGFGADLGFEVGEVSYSQSRPVVDDAERWQPYYADCLILL